jgi:hypothetical protein
MKNSELLSVLAPLMFAFVAGLLVLIVIEFDRGRLFLISKKKIVVASAAAIAALIGSLWAASH